MHVAGNAYYGRYIRTAGLSASIRDEKSWCVSIGFSTAHGDTPIPDSSPVVWYLYLPIWNTLLWLLGIKSRWNLCQPSCEYHHHVLILCVPSLCQDNSYSSRPFWLLSRPATDTAGDIILSFCEWREIKGNLPKQPPAKNISTLSSPSSFSDTCFFFTAMGGRSYIILLQKINSW